MTSLISIIFDFFKLTRFWIETGNSCTTSTLLFFLDKWTTVCPNCVSRFYDWSWWARNDPGKTHFLRVKLYISRPPPPESMLAFVWFDKKQVFSEMTENVRFVRRCASKLLNPSIPKAQERENFHRKYFAEKYWLSPPFKKKKIKKPVSLLAVVGHASPAGIDFPLIMENQWKSMAF